MNRIENQWRICNVNNNGNEKYPRIEIGKHRNELFSSEIRRIKLNIEGKTFYSKLPDSFFNNCIHLNTAYDVDYKKKVNRLTEWLIHNNVRKVKIEIIELYKEFELSIDNGVISKQ